MADRHIWERLKALREFKDLTQQDIADRLARAGIKNAGVGMVEVGKRPIPLPDIITWIDAYGPPPEDRNGLITVALRLARPVHAGRLSGAAGESRTPILRYMGTNRAKQRVIIDAVPMPGAQPSTPLPLVHNVTIDSPPPDA
jgi:hypothetical protein